LVIGATGSGVGKTSLSLGLARALRRQGLRVQTFKVGPDFLDPTYLALASGRTCYNLDGWMTSGEYVRELFERATADADIAIIEGVMGLFDGAGPTAWEGSTAEIAAWLDAPLLLVVHAHGAARSLAATVYGFTHFDPRIHVAGVVANHVGSPRHGALVAESLSAAGLPPLLGAIPRGALPTLPSRHLGLVTADATQADASILDPLADACQQYLDLPRLLELARRGATVGLPKSASCTAGQASSGTQADMPTTSLGMAPETERAPSAIRLGIARDEAFHFYYPDNLEALRRWGAELVPFSPLADAELPAGLDGLYFGGGYPELYADRLAANGALCAAIRRFAAAGRPVYAECGGLMYLGRSLRTLDGRSIPLVGLLPLDTAMRPRLKTLGYADVVLTADSLWGPAGAECRGHEFHYSEITADDTAADGWRQVYTVRRRGQAVREGFAKGPILASYVHLHWASRGDAARAFVAHCENAS
jgi:cobyrinic acid a,c-diamide synthase